MASPRRVVIDDTDSRIHFSGEGWFQDNGSFDDVSGNLGPTYKHTSHGTRGRDSFSFSFEGTSISLIGTTHFDVGVDGSPTLKDPKWECFVDQVSIGQEQPFPYVENNWLLCEENDLDDGPHKFIVTVTTPGRTFWVDYLLFTPLPRASLGDAVLRVNSSDPGITMDSDWQTYQDSSTHLTAVKGSQAKFIFVGTSLTWVGIIFSNEPRSPAAGSFAIDGGPAISFTLDTLKPGSTTTLYNQAFFTTPDLKPGSHSIVVTYMGADKPVTPLTLDYLLVTISPPTPVNIPQISSSNLSPPVPSASSRTEATFSFQRPLTSSPSTQTPTVPDTSRTPSSESSAVSSSSRGNSSSMNMSTTRITSSPTDVSSRNPPTHQHSSRPEGAIIGSILGGLALIGLLLFLFLRRRRQRYQRKIHEIKVFDMKPDISSTSHGLLVVDLSPNHDLVPPPHNNPSVLTNSSDSSRSSSPPHANPPLKTCPDSPSSPCLPSYTSRPNTGDNNHPSSSVYTSTTPSNVDLPGSIDGGSTGDIRTMELVPVRLVGRSVLHPVSSGIGSVTVREDAPPLYTPSLR